MRLFSGQAIAIRAFQKALHGPPTCSFPLPFCQELSKIMVNEGSPLKVSLPSKG